jgi:LPXTG-motif cell wall-anchored protein
MSRYPVQARRNARIPLQGVPGVYLQTGDVLLNEKLVAFLKELRKRLSFDLTVNSGIRSVSRQANAMWTNAQREGGGNLQRGLDYLANLYGKKLVNAGLYNVSSLAGLTALVQRMQDSGIYVSDHMTGNGVDIDNLPSPQLTELKTAVSSMRRDLVPYLELLNEGNHLHLDGVNDTFLTKLAEWTGEIVEKGEELVVGGQRVVTQAARKYGPTILWILAGLSIAGGGYVLYRRRRRRGSR